MAVSKGRKKAEEKPSKEVEAKVEAPVKEVEAKAEPAPQPKEEVKPAKKEVKKPLVLKHSVGDKVKFSGEEWEVLIVVDKQGRERLRIGREGVLRAVWIDDLD